MRPSLEELGEAETENNIGAEKLHGEEHTKPPQTTE